MSTKTIKTLWKVVHVNFPEGIQTPIPNGFAVGYVIPITLQSYDKQVEGVAILDLYSGYALSKHPISITNTLNMNGWGKEHRTLLRITDLTCVNSLYVTDVF